MSLGQSRSIPTHFLMGWSVGGRKLLAELQTKHAASSTRLYILSSFGLQSTTS